MILKLSKVVLLLVVILVVMTGACSNVETQDIKERRTVTPESKPEKSDMGVIPTLKSGVEGYVWIGPTCPVVHEGSECPDKPYETEFTITDVEGEFVAVGKSNADGFFRVYLYPGSYIFVPESGKPGVIPIAEPIPFDVKPEAFTSLDITFDSGIR